MFLYYSFSQISRLSFPFLLLFTPTVPSHAPLARSPVVVVVVVLVHPPLPNQPRWRRPKARAARPSIPTAASSPLLPSSHQPARRHHLRAHRPPPQAPPPPLPVTAPQACDTHSPTPPPSTSRCSLSSSNNKLSRPARSRALSSAPRVGRPRSTPTHRWASGSGLALARARSTLTPARDRCTSCASRRRRRKR